MLLEFRQSLRARKLERPISRQITGADSLWANIGERCGRQSTTESQRFLIIAQGSLPETQGRHRSLDPWLREKIGNERLVLTEKINRILRAVINRYIKR